MVLKREAGKVLVRFEFKVLVSNTKTVSLGLVGLYFGFSLVS